MNIYGTEYADLLFGTNVKDRIYGFAGDDVLYGGDSNDFLDGGSGIDSMTGGTGNDTFLVNNMADSVTELAGQGNDSVICYVDTDIEWLPNHVENLILSGTATYGDGNSFNNVIHGTYFINYLYGHGGDDTLFGYDDNDFLFGGNGNDELDGGIGGDWMFGGAGNDNYYVDAAIDRIDTDTVIEFSGEGFDTVTMVSSGEHGPYTLPENIEYFFLKGDIAFVEGNNLNNTMINGNINAHPDLRGFDGNDTLIGNNDSESLSGDNGNDNLIAQAGRDSLYGGTGSDVLNGGYGVDQLSGNNGPTDDNGLDKFILCYRGINNADYIYDFNHQNDTIVLSNSLDGGMLGEIYPGIKGLTFSGGDIPGNVLDVTKYFEGSGITGNNNSSQLSGIYINTTNGDIWYNPTNNSNDATDAEIIGRVSASVVTSLDNTDFIL